MVEYNLLSRSFAETKLRESIRDVWSIFALSAYKSREAIPQSPELQVPAKTSGCMLSILEISLDHGVLTCVISG